MVNDTLIIGVTERDRPDCLATRSVMSDTAQRRAGQHRVRRVYAFAHHQPLRLRYFCAPQACHGEVIAELLWAWPPART